MCKNCGKLMTEITENGFVRVHHNYDLTLKCEKCGAKASKSLILLIEGIKSLSITPLPDGATARDLRNAIAAAANHIENHFPAPASSFQLGCVSKRGENYKSSIEKDVVRMELTYGYSELSLEIKKHGPDSYSLCEFKYLQSNDDGGRQRFL